MRNYLRIFSIVIVVCTLGMTANLAAADSDRGMERGMMGGHHGYGMGSGMMGGYQGYGMGMGMMGGHHGYGMGPGMMGREIFRGLNLSSDQKSKVSKIRKAVRTKHMELMDEMMDAQDKLHELYDADKLDAAAISKQHKVVDDLRRQMVESSVDAHNQISDILTKEQRDKLRERRREYGPMMWGH